MGERRAEHLAAEGHLVASVEEKPSWGRALKPLSERGLMRSAGAREIHLGKVIEPNEEGRFLLGAQARDDVLKLAGLARASFGEHHDAPALKQRRPGYRA